MTAHKKGDPMSEFSVSPAGEKFALPTPKEYKAEMKRLDKLVKAARAEGREIVVVMGVGFVGAVMAAIVADTVYKKGRRKGEPSKFVIGCQRPSVRSFWKIPLLNRGESPVKAEDPEVAPLIERCVKKRKNLVASFSYDVLSLADTVVVDQGGGKRSGAIRNPGGHDNIHALIML